MALILVGYLGSYFTPTALADGLSLKQRALVKQETCNNMESVAKKVREPLEDNTLRLLKINKMVATLAGSVLSSAVTLSGAIPNEIGILTELSQHVFWAYLSSVDDSDSEWLHSAAKIIMLCSTLGTLFVVCDQLAAQLAADWLAAGTLLPPFIPVLLTASKIASGYGVRYAAMSGLSLIVNKTIERSSPRYETALRAVEPWLKAATGAAITLLLRERSATEKKAAIGPNIQTTRLDDTISLRGDSNGTIIHYGESESYRGSYRLDTLQPQVLFSLPDNTTLLLLPGTDDNTRILLVRRPEHDARPVVINNNQPLWVATSDQSSDQQPSNEGASSQRLSQALMTPTTDPIAKQTEHLPFTPKTNTTSSNALLEGVASYSEPKPTVWLVQPANNSDASFPETEPEKYSKNEAPAPRERRSVLQLIVPVTADEGLPFSAGNVLPLLEKALTDNTLNTHSTDSLTIKTGNYRAQLYPSHKDVGAGRMVYGNNNVTVLYNTFSPQKHPTHLHGAMEQKGDYLIPAIKLLPKIVQAVNQINVNGSQEDITNLLEQTMVSHDSPPPYVAIHPDIGEIATFSEGATEVTLLRIQPAPASADSSIIVFASGEDGTVKSMVAVGGVFDADGLTDANTGSGSGENSAVRFVASTSVHDGVHQRIYNVRQNPDCVTHTGQEGEVTSASPKSILLESLTFNLAGIKDRHPLFEENAAGNKVVSTRWLQAVADGLTPCFKDMTIDCQTFTQNMTAAARKAAGRHVNVEFHRGDTDAAILKQKIANGDPVAMIYPYQSDPSPEAGVTEDGSDRLCHFDSLKGTLAGQCTESDQTCMITGYAPGIIVWPDEADPEKIHVTISQKDRIAAGCRTNPEWAFRENVKPEQSGQRLTHKPAGCTPDKTTIKKGCFPTLAEKLIVCPTENQQPCKTVTNPLFSNDEHIPARGDYPPIRTVKETMTGDTRPVKSENGTTIPDGLPEHGWQPIAVALGIEGSYKETGFIDLTRDLQPPLIPHIVEMNDHRGLLRVWLYDPDDVLNYAEVCAAFIPKTNARQANVQLNMRLQPHCHLSHRSKFRDWIMVEFFAQNDRCGDAEALQLTFRGLLRGNIKLAGKVLGSAIDMSEIGDAELSIALPEGTFSDASSRLTTLFFNDLTQLQEEYGDKDRTIAGTIEQDKSEQPNEGAWYSQLRMVLKGFGEFAGYINKGAGIALKGGGEMLGALGKSVAGSVPAKYSASFVADPMAMLTTGIVNITGFNTAFQSPVTLHIPLASTDLTTLGLYSFASQPWLVFTNETASSAPETLWAGNIEPAGIAGGIQKVFTYMPDRYYQTFGLPVVLEKQVLESGQFTVTLGFQLDAQINNKAPTANTLAPPKVRVRIRWDDYCYGQTVPTVPDDQALQREDMTFLTAPERDDGERRHYGNFGNKELFFVHDDKFKGKEQRDPRGLDLVAGYEKPLETLDILAYEKPPGFTPMLPEKDHCPRANGDITLESVSLRGFEGMNARLNGQDARDFFVEIPSGIETVFAKPEHLNALQIKWGIGLIRCRSRCDAGHFLKSLKASVEVMVHSNAKERPTRDFLLQKTGAVKLPLSSDKSGYRQKYGLPAPDASDVCEKGR